MQKVVTYINSTIDDCRLITLPKFATNAGNITALNNNVDLPFSVERVYYMYDIPSGETRGGHSHKQLYQLVVAAMGSFDFIISDGKNSKRITLNRPDMGILIVPGIWREIENFSAGTVLLVMASEIFHENDYIRDYSEYINYKDGTNI